MCEKDGSSEKIPGSIEDIWAMWEPGWCDLSLSPWGTPMANTLGHT